MPRPQLLFLLGLPRSGSTLLQRLIATHPAVATSAEPWILLPLLDVVEERGRTLSVYGHHLAVQAVRECAKDAGASLDALVRRWALDFYTAIAPAGAHYFLDKTPPYSILARRLVPLFPEAKFVWIVRQPLAVVASLVSTFADGKWYLYHYFFTLYEGIAQLVNAFEAHPKRILHVRYEDLLADPEAELRRVFAFLGLDPNEADWRAFAKVKLPGTMQDPTGTKRYQTLSREPLEKWKQAFTNPFRKAWARAYLRWIGPERLRVMGYDLAEILHELDAIPTRWRGTAGDALRHLYGLWQRHTQAEAAALMRALPWERQGILF